MYYFREANVSSSLAILTNLGDTGKTYLREEDVPEVTEGHLRMYKLNLATFKFKKGKHSGCLTGIDYFYTRGIVVTAATTYQCNSQVRSRKVECMQTLPIPPRGRGIVSIFTC